METIWEGDVKEFSRAFDLICIVDQIHDYATKQHREFIMKHLEAWYARDEKIRESGELSVLAPDAGASNNMASEDSDVEMINADLGGSGLDVGDENGSMDTNGHIEASSRPGERAPEWFRLKQEAKFAKQKKAHQTRARNRKENQPA